MTGTVIQGLDLMDIVHFVSKKNKKFQAILLQDVEEVLGKNTPEYAEVRRLILDSYNAYTRSVLRVVFGNDFDI